MYDPENRLTDAYEPEVGTIPSDAEGRDEENVTKTGTTTVGISTEDGVVIATDRRASLGGRFVSNKSVTKVEQIHPTAAMTLVGSVGGAQSFIRSLRSEANLYEVRRDEPLSIHALATLAGNFARGGPFFAINPIIGGVDEEGSHIYSVDPAGGVLQDEYTVTGSGTMVATGTIEGNYDPEMSIEEARGLAIRAVQAAAERDTGSGNGIVLAEITDEGVDIDRFDDYESAE
ncbi:archaeal proteasome endopeptidase complex subunit beta [Halomicroarcula sp. F28]|uniref:archaeal proteasome endopeptidase complex subunit beta n=1 Tax=Haloarcula salinisoli TaxID=2487746 RepID=UPI001C73612A|nr:archaeal proteasome endopeptidase complex subunit beta [Halomicroarcula salinisoli]MBX0286214.1 archaeal proteasome endopeptidase complex subunit beta [Halomicroarcula salinisoli]